MILRTIALRDGTRAAVEDADGGVHPLSPRDLGLALAHGGWRDAAERALQEPPVPDWEPSKLLPSPSKILCCGVNYLDHIREMGRERPQHPTLFAKFADSLAGADADLQLSGTGIEHLDWEAELAVVVGTPVRNADRDTAAAAIAGYTVANDISARDWQNRTLQWLQGKAWEGMTPVGPVMVTADAFDPSSGAAIECRVDGELVQSSTTDQLLFDSADLVAYVSSFVTLRAGDLVLTGTPGGVGAGMNPPRFLRPGALVETWVEGIGTLRNRVL